MKMYDGILKRVKQIEEKNGIKYATCDGKAYKFLKVLYIVAFSWGILMNLLFVLGNLLLYSGTENNTRALYYYTLPIGIGSLLLIAGLVFCCLKKHIVSCVLSVVPSVVMLVLFGTISTDSIGFLGMKTWYYWRHLAPLGIIIIAIAFMTYIALRANYKVKKLYIKVTENLFAQYGDVSELGDEEWDAFLQNYNHETYRKQFVKQTVTEENEG